MSDLYKAFLSDNKPSPEHVVTTPLSLSLPNPPFDESIQDFVTDSSISSSSDSLGKCNKSFKTFANSDMNDCKEISSGKSINFDESTTIYAHSSGSQKSQTTPTDACKDDGAQLIVANIYPLRTFPEASNHLSSIMVALRLTR